MDPVIARKTWRTLEPIHGMIYFVPEADERYRALGLTTNRMGYFASRSAAMGPVPAEVVIATFFNFHPNLVRRSIPEAWSHASPDKILAARFDAADAALRRAWGEGVSSAEVEEAAVLARRAAEAAVEHPEGRPLFAAHATLDWPDAPHVVLWHAQTLLREFRGDAHVAALTLEGLRGVDALIIHGATGDVPSAVLQASRAWPDDEWAAGVDGLRSRGLIDADGALTEAGRSHRQWVEDRTDERATIAYDAIGEDGCERLRQLCRPLSKAVVEGGLLAVDPARFTQ
jgi:hypothetical protein